MSVVTVFHTVHVDDWLTLVVACSRITVTASWMVMRVVAIEDRSIFRWTEQRHCATARYEVSFRPSFNAGSCIFGKKQVATALGPAEEVWTPNPHIESPWENYVHSWRGCARGDHVR